MLNFLENYSGRLIVNGTEYPSLEEARSAFRGFKGQITIVINPEAPAARMERREASEEISGSPIYQIKVRQYMTKPASPEFDFQDKFNKGVPMPMRIMVGKKLKETRGMVQMELWGEIVGEQISQCMKCGRTLTNPVSRYFGIGPECGGHGYVHPFESEDQLQAAISKVGQELREIKWTGWIIKSSLEQEEIIRYE